MPVQDNASARNATSLASGLWGCRFRGGEVAGVAVGCICAVAGWLWYRGGARASAPDGKERGEEEGGEESLRPLSPSQAVVELVDSGSEDDDEG